MLRGSAICPKPRQFPHPLALSHCLFARHAQFVNAPPLNTISTSDVGFTIVSTRFSPCA
jgi:hypothetical protein